MEDLRAQDLQLHWEMTQKHSEDIAKLTEGQARLEAGVASLVDRVSSGFSNIRGFIRTCDVLYFD